jgi:cell division protein FtsB
MKFFKMMIAILMTTTLVSSFWLQYHANQRNKIKELRVEIQALQQEQYEQRKEIAQYHVQEIKLRREVTRLRNSLEKPNRDIFQTAAIH